MNADKFDTEIENLLGSYNPEFKPGFSERVMKRIANMETDIFSIFKWVVLSGAAAIILLLLTVYFTEGSFSSDAIFGIINYSEEESLITAYNF